MSTIDHNRVVRLLGNVKDPQSGRDIIEARMVENFRVSGNEVHFNLILPAFNVPYKSALIFDCMQMIKSEFPDAEVNIHGTVRDAHGEKSSPLAQVKNILTVASGKGGVGKSTVAVNMAVTLNRLGHSVGILDADLYGPSIPIMLGLKDQRPRVEKIYGVQKMIPLQWNDIPVMSLGFIIKPDQAVVLRGPKLSGHH